MKAATLGGLIGLVLLNYSKKRKYFYGNKLLQWNKLAYDWTSVSFTQSTPCALNSRSSSFQTPECYRHRTV